MNKTDWIECPQDGLAPQALADYLSINPKGQIIFGAALYQRLGSPAAFVLLYDPQTHRIGLRPADVSTRNACEVKRSGKHGGRIVRGFRLIHEFRIEIAEPLEFTSLRLDDEGVLILDLRTARPSVRSATRRSWMARSKALKAQKDPAAIA